MQVAPASRSRAAHSRDAMLPAGDFTRCRGGGVGRSCAAMLIGRDTLVLVAVRLLAAALAIAPATFAAAAAGAAPATTAPLTGNAVLEYLNATIDWYRRVESLDAPPVNSQELLLRATVREDARQAVRLALRFARAQAAILEASPATAPATVPGARGLNGGDGGRGARDGAPAPRARTLAQVAAGAAERAAQLQAQVEQVTRELQTNASTSRPALAARRDQLVAQLELATAQRDVLRQYAGFVAAAQTGGSVGLAQKIAELERSVPELAGEEQAGAADAGGTAGTVAAAASASAAATVAAAAQQPAAQAQSAGILSLLREMLGLSGRVSELEDLAGEAQRLAGSNEQLRAPVRGAIIDAVRRAESIGAATQPTDDPAALDAQRLELAALTARFKQLSAAGVPLGEQGVLLDATRRNLLSWRGTLTRQYTRILRDLAVRLAFVGAVVVALVVGSELWRRATYRYVTDARRRRQLMVIRRVAVAVAVVVIIVASVVSEFGSLATFAGLITAGIAVALQTVILSGVAYFFFIGRFGVRVGDRVTISNITGEVIEVGLFRLYMMELSGKSPDLHPTGRIVVFSNAVLFQPSAFYKQLPGANYAWRELTFTLAPDTDYRVAEQRLMGAVTSVFGEYRDSLESQQAKVSRSLHVAMEAPQPQGRLRFVEAGLEFVVRYPVELRRAAEIDDQVTRRLLDAVNQEPTLRLVPSGTPKIQPAA